MNDQPEVAAHGPAPEGLLDVVVVGGGQAGLAMAWHLRRQGMRFVVLEAGPELGHVWRARWDSLKLFTPARYSSLPGMPFPAPADSYPTKEPVADYLQAYATAFHLPVTFNARVSDLRRAGEIFEVRAGDAVYRARQVVVATGPFQVPFTPPPARKLDASVTQLHSAAYRNPQDGRQTPAFTLTTRPARPMVGEATAIRQVAASSVPPQDTSAMDKLVEQYSRPRDERNGREGKSGGERRTGRAAGPS
jgi:glycine/D-amino acid oxidase-like deaminating enzyme